MENVFFCVTSATRVSAEVETLTRIAAVPPAAASDQTTVIAIKTSNKVASVQDRCNLCILLQKLILQFFS